MEGSYREQIVESESRRLDRARQRYQQRWKLIAARWFVFIPFLVAASAMMALVQYSWFFALAMVVPVSAYNWWYRTLKCPHCGGGYLGMASNPHDTCASCGIEWGYLPTAEDLNDDEPGPG